MQPTVASVRPSPSTCDRTPTLAATVRDDRAELSRDDIGFSLDARQRDAFSYDAATDRLSYDTGRLSLGKHTASISATDPAGNTTTRTWTLKLVRR